MEINQKLYDGVVTSLFNYTHNSSEEYRPKLLTNNKDRGYKILTNIIQELNRCDEFLFSVAFITNSGISTIIETLKNLEKKKVKGKIITSEYLCFTEPIALKRLSMFKNIELRISPNIEKFHSKCYIFKRKDAGTVILGSSNLTQNALCVNNEWNIKFTALQEGKLYSQIVNEFSYVYGRAIPVTQSFIEKYEKIYNQNKRQSIKIQEKNVNLLKNDIVPNKMQCDALVNLEKIRKKGENKALVISATGTGKTFLSAFDVKKYMPKKFLFIIHRENIARKAMEDYRKVLGLKNKRFGLLTGSKKEYNADFLFSTIQTLSKDEVLEKFEKDYFDYIVIDEVHHIEASTYQKILNYFCPKFLLGMSATPERTDGNNIFKYFNYNIAYEIRLNEALKNDMVVPFHYYGIADIKVDGTLLNEEENFSNLVDDERVKRIIEASKFYSYSGNRIRAIVFCSRVDETIILAKKFNEKGLRAIALNGDSNEEERKEAIRRLETDESDYIEYIFTVDIFNEGIDIPSVNQIIMLRATKSAIVFIQQLGRGLRKYEDKEFLVVIDFIGNYKNNYLLPIALFGDNSCDKEKLRSLIRVGKDKIYGASTINFDKISENKIFEAINCNNLQDKKTLYDEYNFLKYKIGKIPLMMDFIRFGNIDPMVYANFIKSTYYNYIKAYDVDYVESLSEKHYNFLEYCTKEIVMSKRLEDSYILKELITKNKVVIPDIIDKLEKDYNIIINKEDIICIKNNINGDFLKQSDLKKYYLYNFVHLKDNILVLDNKVSRMLENTTFRKFLEDLLSYSVYSFNKIYNSRNYNKGFILYERYTRRQVLRILKFKKDIPGLNIGGYIYNKENNVLPVFITYVKDKIKMNNNYINSFKKNDIINVISKPNRTMEAPEINALLNYENNKIRVPLFVKKEDAEGGDFYYLGDMYPVKFEQITIKDNKKAVDIEFKLFNPVEENLLNYFLN